MREMKRRRGKRRHQCNPDEAALATDAAGDQSICVQHTAAAAVDVAASAGGDHLSGEEEEVA